MKAMKISRPILLLALLVLTQACAAASVQSQAPNEPHTVAQAAEKPRVVVKELSGCSGERFKIDMLDAIDKIPDDTLDAQREQLRDWIFTVTLARIAQRLGAEEVLTGVASEPLVRDDALSHVLPSQSGTWRSTATKAGSAIILVQADEPAAIDAAVAEAIDAEAFHIGHTPVEAQVYQYTFHRDTAHAEVCAMKSLSRAEMEGTEKGYRTATITTAKDLEDFLSGGVDLLSAACTEAGLEVQGRKRPRAAGAPITVEHIAALSQARGTTYVPIARFGASLEKLSKANRATLDHNAKVVDTLTQPLEIQSAAIQIVSAWKRKNPKVPTQELWMSYELQADSVGRPGFSLDPHMSASFTAARLDRFIDALPDLETVAALLRGLDKDPTWLLDLSASTNEPFVVDTKAALIATREKLKNAKDEDVEAIIYAPLPSSLGNQVASNLLQTLATTSAQQCARYDGPLLGTETGMTFFYTDLLAKIWKFDLNHAAPEGPIEGFRSGLHDAASAAACSDTEGRNTRTWLGVREEAFSREASGAVRFQPIATRIFAKSSKFGARHDEFEATGESRQFVTWWDEHYGAIAEWEPQYELLNQLMKWSVAIHNATVQRKLECFAPLDNYPVRVDRRIDRWIAQTDGLRWRGPVDLLRDKSGAEGKPGDPECMEFFQSAHYEYCGGSRQFSGGVSAATVEGVRAKPLRTPDLSPELGRLGASAAPATKPGLLKWPTLKRNGGTLKDVDVERSPTNTRFSAEISGDLSQNGKAVSWEKSAPIRKFIKALTLKDKNVVITERKNGLVSAELKTTDLNAADVKVDLKASGLHEARLEAQKIAESVHLDGSTLEAAVAPLASKTEVVVLGEGRVAWKVTIDGKPKWVLMESGGGNRGPPPRGATVQFTMGVPSGTPHQAGSSLASRNQAFLVTVLGHLGEKLKTSPINGRAANVEAIGKKLAENDFEGAKALVIAQPSPEGLNALMTHALKDPAGKNVKAVVDSALKSRAQPSALEALARSIDDARIRRAREGLDTSQLEAEHLRLAIAKRKALSAASADTPKAAEAQVYAPASYPSSAALPPSVHPRGKLVMPDEQYITRTLDDIWGTNLPAEVEVGGVRYKARSTGQERAPEAWAIGSARRLLFGVRRPVQIVLPCSDQDEAMPPCHDRRSPEEKQSLAEAMKCDKDGDRRLRGQQEIDCLDAQRKEKDAKKQQPSPSAL